MILKIKNNQVDKPTKLLVKTIEDLTVGYADKNNFMLMNWLKAWPRLRRLLASPVIIRLSDFKLTNIAPLIGGDRYEPVEENPMIGWRGARVIIIPILKRLWVGMQALLKVRQEMGLKM